MDEELDELLLRSLYGVTIEEELGSLVLRRLSGGRWKSAQRFRPSSWCTRSGRRIAAGLGSMLNEGRAPWYARLCHSVKVEVWVSFGWVACWDTHPSYSKDHRCAPMICMRTQDPGPQYWNHCGCLQSANRDCFPIHDPITMYKNIFRL